MNFLGKAEFAAMSEYIKQLVTNTEKGICIRTTPNSDPIKMCSREATEGSYCCTRHQDECPVKKTNVEAKQDGDS